MSWQASTWVLKQQVGDSILKFLLLTAANYADPDGVCWPKVEVLANDTEVSVRTIQRKLSELQELGFIKVTHRFDNKGRQTSSEIQILMGAGEGDSLSPLSVGVTPSSHPGGDTTLSPTESLNNHKNKQSTSASKKKEDGSYNLEFEEIWKQAAELGAPRTRATSKKKAHDHWRMLNEENRLRVKRAVPIFAAQMHAEGRPEDKIKHFQFFLSERIYETVSAPAASASAGPDIPWYKTATREQWGKVLNIWSGTNNWSQSWGPEPGKPGCAVPVDMVAAHNVKHRGHLFSDEQLEVFRSQSRVP